MKDFASSGGSLRAKESLICTPNIALLSVHISEDLGKTMNCNVAG